MWSVLVSEIFIWQNSTSVKYDVFDDQETILNTLTPDDIRMLIEFVGEDSRRGHFERIFPTASSRKYHRYFERQRYYNLLLDAWCRQYARSEFQGLLLYVRPANNASCAQRHVCQNPAVGVGCKFLWTRARRNGESTSGHYCFRRLTSTRWKPFCDYMLRARGRPFHEVGGPSPWPIQQIQLDWSFPRQRELEQKTVLQRKILPLLLKVLFPAYDTRTRRVLLISLW